MGLVEKVLDFVGYNSSEYDDEYYEEERVNDYEEEQNVPEYEPPIRSRRGKIVTLNQNAPVNLVVVKPEVFDEARDAANHLKERKTVVMNLENVDLDVARRIVDFMSGAVFALDANIRKVSNGIFVIAPNNVGIMGDFKDDFKKSSFLWN